MLSIVTDRAHRDCDGLTRRDFLGVGMLGMGALGLPGLLQARAHAASSGQTVRDTSVVWLWLGGGPTQVETFDPKMTAPVEYRSVTGETPTKISGLTLGGTFPRIAGAADKMVFVRSFAHSDSGHGGGTHFVMTGYDDPGLDNGGSPSRPSMGSILSAIRGPNHAQTGMPTYCRQGEIAADGPAFLSPACTPFDPGGEARRNMTLAVPRSRIADRRLLMQGLDRMNRQVDTSGVMNGLDAFERQAFNLVLSRAPEAFDLTREEPKLSESYGGGLGKQLLLARRLCEAGCGFVTIHYGGWDMHGDIKRGMENISPQMDRAVAAFVQDVHQRGLSEKILLVITGEFGRTPRVNGGAGRDHWAPLSTLALAGGGLRMGGVIGESSEKVEVPKSTPITPQDLLCTVFEVLGIPRDVQFVNRAGRPTYMLEGGKPIAELVG